MGLSSLQAIVAFLARPTADRHKYNSSTVSTTVCCSATTSIIVCVLITHLPCNGLFPKSICPLSKFASASTTTAPQPYTVYVGTYHVYASHNNSINSSTYNNSDGISFSFGIELSRTLCLRTYLYNSYNRHTLKQDRSVQHLVVRVIESRLCRQGRNNKCPRTS